MNIAIMGFRDKRHIFYSLLKILSNIGRVAFITPNPCYKQLSEDFSSEFEIEDTDILIVENLYDVDTMLDLENYDFVIWDCLTELPEKIELLLMIDHPDMYRAAINELDSKPKYQFIAKGENALKNEKIISIIKASSVEEILTKVEKDRVWYPITGFVHNKSMSELLCSSTGINKNKLLSYLKRRGAHK